MASGQGLWASSGASLANITSKLPPAAQAYLAQFLAYLARVTQYAQSATGLSATTLYTTLVGILLVAAIPVVSARNNPTNKRGKKMTSRYGLFSPWGSSLGQSGVPAVTDQDYSYITSEDLEDFDVPRGHHHHHDADSYSHSAPGPAASFGQRKPADDVMLIKYGGVTYPEHFPAYSIGDGKLEVSDVVSRVQLILNLSDREVRRMRLFYKGRQLKEGRAPIREYGVKNNSEVMVVFGEPSGDSDEELVVIHDERDYDAPKRKKSKRRSRRQEDRSPTKASTTSLNLEVPFEDDRRRATSRVRTRSPSSMSGVSGASGHSVPSAISGASAAAAVPGGPIDKLNSIAGHFDTKLKPLCMQYIEAPPSDKKKKEDEHRRLSETVMQQVILKLDEVETHGEESARARRKELVREVQYILKKMDETLKATKS